jgi:hypothetical protein
MVPYPRRQHSLNEILCKIRLFEMERRWKVIRPQYRQECQGILQKRLMGDMRKPTSLLAFIDFL